MKPAQVEPGQRWHDDDEPDDPGYGERCYTVLENVGPMSWTMAPGDWWSVKYDDGYESRIPASWILRDTPLFPPPDGQDVGKVGP